MKNTLLILSAFLYLSCLSACGNASESAKDDSKPVLSKNQDPCLTTKRDKLVELLTPEMVKMYAEGKEMEHDAREIPSGNGDYNYIQYSWEGEGTRKMEVAGMSMDIPNKCHIQLGGIKWIEKEDPVQDFNHVYKTASAEDMQKLKEEFNKQMDKSEDLSEERKEPGKKVGGGMLNEMNKTNYEAVNGIGDAAKWETSYSKMKTPSSGALHVQIGQERFTVDVDLGGDDSSKSKAAAIELAKKLIAGCN